MPIRKLALGAASLALAMNAAAQTEQTVKSRPFVEPPALGETVTQTPLLKLALPAGAAHPGTERNFDLAIRYTDSQLYDPQNSRFQKVRLRSYVGTGVSPDTPFIAPEINVTPGDTVRITLKNDLPADASCTSGGGGVDSPHCFNGTNLHSHGLWVSPTGNSDNVLLSINPGISFQYEYNIPEDHPAGTFWYHPHRHGSTALQVSSGMAGALVIHSDRKPTPKVNGDLDTLLVSPDGKPFPDRTIVFQQIQYACLGPDGKLKYDAQGAIIWTCTANETGVIESYNQFGPGTWATSGRWTSINGIVLPTFNDVRSGQVERWRLIHAGVRDTITVEFHKLKAGVSPESVHPSKAAAPKFVESTCTGPAVPYQVVAADGLTMGNTQTDKTVTLQPGYRYDLLTVFPEPGLYCMTEAAVPASGSVAAAPKPTGLLGLVQVGPGTTTADPTKTLVETLVASAKAVMPADVKDEIVRGLENKDAAGKPNPLLTRFVPHPTVTDEEVAGTPQEDLVFFIGTGDPSATQFAVGKSFDVIDFGGYNVPKGAAPYDPNRIDRALTLGKAQQWELRSYSVSHPFHIHVNPFQIVAIYDPQGHDVSLPGYKEADGDSQFAGLKGAWKDTLWVKTNLNPGQLTNPPANYYRLIVRTRYERYIGEFVLHCHILDHEDQGMMENVQIGVPDGAGGFGHAHH